MTNTNDIAFMQQALLQAQMAAKQGEVPVGAVLVCHDEIVASAHNAPISEQDPSAHAEVRVLRAAASKLDNYRLVNTTLYVSLEPCLMCVGAIVHARVARVVYGASDPKSGAAHSCMHGFDLPFLNHRVACSGGVLQSECGAILSQFFQSRR